MTEEITYAFDGDFSGGYRDIPLREGERVDGVEVSEGTTSYRPGACTELGCSSPAGTYGVEQTADRTRIVWHYAALDEARTFKISYRLRGVTVAYDDVVDVNVRLWGDEWEQRLGKLEGTVHAQGPVSRAWGHPVSVRGDVTIDDETVLYRALDIPPRTFVEARVLFPREYLSSTAGADVRGGQAFDRIVAEEVGAAEDYARDQEQIDEAVDDLPRTLGLLALIALLPASLLVLWVYMRFGRELDVGYDREYEQEPPSELAPALVPPLVAQRAGVGSNEFTATLFDLVRRGIYRAAPVTTERSVWAGLRTEEVADLELSHGSSQDGLEPYEEAVARVVNYVIHDGPERLSNFRDRIEDDRVQNSKRFKKFKDDVASAVSARNWFSDAGLVPLLGAALLFGGLGVLLFWLGRRNYSSVAPTWSSVVLLALGVCGLVNAVVAGATAAFVRLWRRRRPEAQLEAERWEAFRRYLTDFPRLHEAAPTTLELWERYLVYGIAFGIAERVLQGAHLHMPDELHKASSIYWISPNGDLGSGPSALAISDLSSGFGSALAPPNSGGSGGGGGGGGGAW